jgi:hypothetical protein
MGCDTLLFSPYISRNYEHQFDFILAKKLPKYLSNNIQFNFDDEKSPFIQGFSYFQQQFL